VHRTLWRYIPATNGEELRLLERLRAVGPEERDAPIGGTTVPIRLSLLVEPPCDGKAAVGVELAFAADGGRTEAETQAWGLCEEFLARHLER
jgi:hypothetical protein